MPSESKHIPLLDGFRALAIILVLLVHTNLTAFQFGWIGVPMFFVLSGYLITRILKSNKNSEHYFKVFYYRRVLRIFPIYYLVLFVCYAWGMIMRLDVSQLPYYLFYIQSFTISNAVGPVFSNGLLGHSWSLSVEEIFYLVWPAIVYFASKPNLVYICFSLILFSFIYKMIQLYYGEETKSMLSLFGNIDGLMAGALLCLYSGNTKAFFIQKQRVFSFILILFSFVCVLVPFYSPDSILKLGSKIGLSVSISWLSFYAILHLVDHSHSKLITMLLGNKFMLFTGKISYGIYLYHVPVYMFVGSILYHYKIYLNSVLEILLKIIICFVVASISWYMIEKPLLNLKSKIVY